MLVASAVEDKVIATAAEYQVTQIFTEAITLKNLGGRLTSMLIADSTPNDIKKALQAVVEARADGKHKEALNILQKTLKNHPTHLRLKCEAAETLMALGEWDKAYTLVSGLEKAQPPYLRAIHLLGRCLMKQGKMTEAVRTMESANLFNPKDSDRLIDIGNAFLQLDRIKEAEAQFDAALAVDPDLKPAKVGKGSAKLLDGKVNEALGILREVAGDLELASLFNTTAILNARRGRHEAGQSLYLAGLKALGKDERLQARLHFNMGIGYKRWGKPEKALPCFETAVRLDPAFARARELLAEARGENKPPRDKIVAPTERPSVGASLVDLSAMDAPLDEDDLMEESLFDPRTL
jgi:tetratricopeptide (TPR) repeat protein